MSGWGATYSDGTVSIGSGATSVVGVGTMWGILAAQANLLILPTYGLSTLVSDVADDTHLTIPQWGSTVIAAAPYILVQFPLASLLASRQLRDALAKLAGIGVIYYVTAAAPDDEVGDDGDFALKINSGPFKIWSKVSGHWTLQGSPIGTNWQGEWSSVTAYAVNDVTSRNGKLWIAKLAGTSHVPETSPTYWDVYLSNGDRYDLAIFDTDRPASGETIAKLSVAKGMTLTYRAGLTESSANADVAATGSSVFSIKKNGTQFATMTFAPSSATGVFACASDTVLHGDSGDVLTIVAPSPRDATLSGVAGTLVGYRS